MTLDSTPNGDNTPSRPVPIAAKSSERPFSSPSEIVTFITGKGDEETLFVVHKQFACKHSSVWNTAFNGNFIEGNTQTYRLEDTTRDAFQLLVQWLYQEKLDLPVHGKDDDLTSEGHTERCSEQDRILVELWTLGDRFLIRPLQNYVMAQMHSIQSVCGKASSTTYKHVYENTADGSPLRRFAVDQVCWLNNSPGMTELNVMPVEMLKDIVLLLAKQTPANVRPKRAAAMAASDYYVSEDQ